MSNNENNNDNSSIGVLAGDINDIDINEITHDNDNVNDLDNNSDEILENIADSITSSILLDDEDKTNTTKSLDVVLDYKKASLAKLRTIAENKGLVSSTNASKLKKNDLLKLLETEV